MLRKKVSVPLCTGGSHKQGLTANSLHPKHRLTFTKSARRAFFAAAAQVQSLPALIDVGGR